MLSIDIPPILTGFRVYITNGSARVSVFWIIARLCGPTVKFSRPPDGSLEAEDPDAQAYWTLHALVEAAHALGHSGRAQPGPADLARRGRALAHESFLGHQQRSGLCPKRTAVVTLYTNRLVNELMKVGRDRSGSPPYTVNTLGQLE